MTIFGVTIFKRLDMRISRNLLAHGRTLTRGGAERSGETAARLRSRRRLKNGADVRRNAGATSARA